MLVSAVSLNHVVLFSQIEFSHFIQGLTDPTFHEVLLSVLEMSLTRALESISDLMRIVR